MIFRMLKAQILQSFQQRRKINILFAARQVGKTTLIKKIIEELPFKTLEINADELKYNDIYNQKISRLLKKCIGVKFPAFLIAEHPDGDLHQQLWRSFTTLPLLF